MNEHLSGVDIEKMINDVSGQLKDAELPPSTLDKSKYTKQDKDKAKDTFSSEPIEQLNINQVISGHDNQQESIQKTKSKYDEIFLGSHEDNSEDLSSSIKRSSTLTAAELKKSFDIKRTDSFQKDDFLQPIDWDYINSSNIFLIENEFNTISQSINRAELYKLCTSISNCNLDKTGVNPSIGSLTSLQFLIESQFLYDLYQIELMTNHMSQLDKLIFKWRSIKGDGNCFYRAIIFSFLENIILSKNIPLMKEIITDLNERLNNMKEFNVFLSLKNSIEKIDIYLIVQILYLIAETMDNNKPDVKPLEILVKCFLFCSKFDLGMIFYLRCLLYDYIKKNKNKIYTTDFSVKIGNLLPAEYETENGEFLYDEFFEENLLKMYTDAEKIVIYLIPFALKCDLNVIIYEFDTEDAVTEMSFPCYLYNKPKIEVLYRKTHYDLIYTQKYFNDNIKVINYHVNNNENQQQHQQQQNQQQNRQPHQLMQSSLPSTAQSLNRSQTQPQSNISQSQINPSKSSIKESAYNKTQTYQINESLCTSCNTIYAITQNTLSLCNNCLIEELRNLIFGFYLQYLIHVNQFKKKTRCNYRQTFDKYFREKTCIINNTKILLTQAIEIAKINLLVMIKEMKTKLCVQCQNVIKATKDIWFTLPCDCLLCSKECFTAYFDDLMVKELTDCKDNKIQCYIFNYCLCGYQLNSNDYAKLYIQFEKNDMKKLNKTLKGVMMNNLQQNCMKCLSPRSNLSDVIYKAMLKDEKITLVYKEKEFFHIICNKCHEKVGKAKKIECCICNNMHTVLKFKQLTGKDEEDCVIF